MCVLLEDFGNGWGGHWSEKLVWEGEVLGTAWSWCDTKPTVPGRKRETLPEAKFTVVNEGPAKHIGESGCL